MNADEREEIAASVGAHAELGPRYDGAVAEGLVERIGEEIDRRVDARLRGLGQQEVPRQGGMPPGQRIVPSGYHGGQQPAAPPVPAAAPPVAPVAPEVRRSGGVTGVILGLGSMGLGLGATAVVVAHHVTASAAVIMVLLIWAAIAVINIAHSQRR